jgi:hypothetical protein
VAIFESEQLCVPLITMNKKSGRRIPIAVAVEKETLSPVQG